MDDRIAWIALSKIEGLVAADVEVASQQLGDVSNLLTEPALAAEAVFEAARIRLGSVGTVDLPVTPPSRMFETADLMDAARIARNVERSGAKVLCFGDEVYPFLLQQVPDAPAVLFVRGSLKEEDALSIAVVGSRNTTSYGLAMVEPLVRDLVEAGCSIVSGMARGLDAAAHRATLKSGGRTLAVLGSGIHKAYPRSSADLFDAIPHQGAIVSEYEPDVRAWPHQFLARNRIIAALARAVLVIEAGPRSGTANTVRHALGYHRPVYAVPGDVTLLRSAGTNRLIVEDRARPIRRASDLLSDLLGPQWSSPEPTTEKSTIKGGEEGKVWRALANGCRGVDDIARSTGLVLKDILGSLARLEMTGHITRNAGGCYIAVIKG